MNLNTLAGLEVKRLFSNKPFLEQHKATLQLARKYNCTESQALKLIDELEANGKLVREHYRFYKILKPLERG